MEIGILTIYVLSFINVFYYMKHIILYTMVEKKTLIPLFACRSMPQSQDVIQKDGSVRPQLWHMGWFSSMMLQDVLVGMASKIIGHTFETLETHFFNTLDAQLWTWKVSKCGGISPILQELQGPRRRLQF